MCETCKHIILFPATDQILIVTRICVHANDIVNVLQSEQVYAASIEQGLTKIEKSCSLSSGSMRSRHIQSVCLLW